MHVHVEIDGVCRRSRPSDQTEKTVSEGTRLREDLRENALHLLSQVAQRGVVLTRIIGPGALHVQGLLQFLASSQFALGPVPRFFGPRDTLFDGGIHKDHCIAQQVKIRFVEQRTVQHNHFDSRLSLVHGDLIGTAHSDSRMKQGLQFVPLNRVVEDDRADLAAVNRAIRREYARPPPATKRFLYFGVVDLLMAQLVRIDHAGAELAEYLGDTALAGPDASGQSDQRFAATGPVRFVSRGPYSFNPHAFRATGSIRFADDDLLSAS